MNELEVSLEQFRHKVNTHPRLRSLLKGWNRIAGITATDSGVQYTLTFRDSCIVEITHGAPGDQGQLQIEASEALLRGVFSGETNPATEFLEGRLQVFASDQDQMKLDAITLVLWD